MKTYEPVDYLRQARIDIINASYIPASSDISSEFAVKAPKCSLYFNALSNARDVTWILIRVSAYLTVGTTSPPPVQNTYVTNMPYMQPNPSFEDDGIWLHAPITNGYGWNSTSVYIGGYSRMFIQIVLTNASYQGVPSKTTVSLYSIQWGDFGYENVPPGSLNATYNGLYLPVYSYQTPPEFKTKSSYCTLNFNINSEALSAWIEFDVHLYLRNE